MRITSSDIPHMWAHQKEHRGELAAKSGNVSYEGGVLYSYNAIIGVRLEAAGLPPLFIMNSTSYSVTTTKHQSRALSAIPRDTEALRILVPYNIRGSYYTAEQASRSIIRGYVEHIGRLCQDLIKDNFKQKLSRDIAALEVLRKIESARLLVVQCANRGIEEDVA